MATASKDRTGMFINADPFVVTADTGRMIKNWCDSGVEDAIYEVIGKVREAQSVEELSEIKNALSEGQKNDVRFKDEAMKRYKQLTA